MKFYNKNIDEIINFLNSDLKGLNKEEVLERQKEFGFNELPKPKQKTLLQIFLKQFLIPLMIILMVAAIASLLIHEKLDAIFIFIVIILNAILGAYQEWSAEKKAHSLQEIIKDRIKVKRDNIYYEIETKDLVVGDIVSLEAGNKVPADMRIISSYQLTVDESFLTGESKSITKTNTILNEDTILAERSNMAYAGSTILTGRAEAVVTEIGINTEVGIIAKNILYTKEEKPPLVQRLEKFTKQISIVVFTLVGIMSIYLFLKGTPLKEIFPFAITLSVSAIPESLPIAVTVVLSIATVRMAKRNVIVRKLNAVESLGSCTIIASDKTGTLTLNEQTVKKVVLPNNATYDIEGIGYNDDGEIIPINSLSKEQSNIDQLKTLTVISTLSNEGHIEYKNNEWIYYGDAMDVALLAFGLKNNIYKEMLKTKYDLKGIIPYESLHRYSTSFYIKNNKNFVGIKGAPETILNFCDKMAFNNEIIDIDYKLILKQANEMANSGYRVLAIAGNEHENLEIKDEYNEEDIPKLVFFGLVGFVDPLRNEINEAVSKCKSAGIKIVMITGDQKETAFNIGKEMNIIESFEKVVDGKHLESLNEQEFDNVVKNTIIFARVTPTQKQLIIESLKKQGDFVAVTGDGVNDAPALKSANIGVAMGSGTDIAIETSSMIVTDDNFMSIVSGVEEGRFAYDNIRKVTYLLISTAIAEILLFAVALFTGNPMPLLPAQILWVNLVTNGIQDVALAFEPGEKRAMQRKPRDPSESLFDKLMITQTLISGIIISIIALAVFYYAYYYLKLEINQVRGLVLLILVILENYHVFNCRSETESTFKIPLSINKVLLYGFVGQVLLQLFAMYNPFMQKILLLQPININTWLAMLSLGIPLLLFMELFKLYRRKYL